MKPCFLFDLDGTLANGAHREHHLKKEPKDWRTYYSLCGADEPHGHMIALLDVLAEKYMVFIVSGRSDEVRGETMDWLGQHTDGLFVDDDVLMRKAGDHRPDTVLKLEMLEEIRRRGYEPLMVFDDRNSVVAMWRKAGIPCAHVAEGDF